MNGHNHQNNHHDPLNAAFDDMVCEKGRSESHKEPSLFGVKIGEDRRRCVTVTWLDLT